MNRRILLLILSNIILLSGCTSDEAHDEISSVSETVISVQTDITVYENMDSCKTQAGNNTEMTVLTSTEKRLSCSTTYAVSNKISTISSSNTETQTIGKISSEFYDKEDDEGGIH